MKSNLFKFALIVLTVGILSACGAQPTEAPASAPTEASVPATQAPTNPPADTVAPTDTTAAQPTEAPATESAAPAGATVSFATDIGPLLSNRCGSCHGDSRKREGLSVTTYADLMKGSDNGPVIMPGNSDSSLLVDLVASQEMPKQGPKLTPSEVQLLVDWVNQGALDN